jgi:hypothetical protein
MQSENEKYPYSSYSTKKIDLYIDIIYRFDPRLFKEAHTSEVDSNRCRLLQSEFCVMNRLIIELTGFNDVPEYVTTISTLPRAPASTHRTYYRITCQYH